MSHIHALAERTSPTTPAEANPRYAPSRWRVALVGTALALIAASCSSGGAETPVEAVAQEPPTEAVTAPAPTPTATPEPAPEPATEGAVTIAAVADFTGEVVVGTFVVNEGDEILGCFAGRFEDVGGPLGVDRTLSCDTGSRSGSITVRFEPEEAPGPGDLNGPWDVRGATGDFVGLAGSGDFSVTFSADGSSGTESLTGEIAYGDPTTSNAVPSTTVARLNQPGASCFDGFGTTDGLEEYATVDDTMLRLTIATGDVTEHGAPPVECALWLGNEEAGRRIATAPDSMRIWFGPFDGPWDVQKELDEPLFLMSRSFDANRLVFVSNDGRSAVMLDATTGDQVGEALEASFADGRSFSATAANADGTVVAVGAANPDEGADNKGRVFLVDAATGAVRHQLDVVKPVTAMVFAPSHDGTSEELVVAGVEGMVTTIDVDSGGIVAEVQTSTPGDAVLAIGERPDGLLVVGSERSAELIDRQDGPTGTSIELSNRDAGRIRADGAIVTIRNGFTYEIFDDLAQG